MAATINAYVPDQGELSITLTSANITAIAAFTTAEAIIVDNALRSFRRTNSPQRGFDSTRVTGSTTPILTVGDTVDNEEWEAIFVDDYSEGLAGEFGTDLLAAYEIFNELFVARESLGLFTYTPAGGATGDIEYTLTSPQILSVGTPDIDADQVTPNETAVQFASTGHTFAAHS